MALTKDQWKSNQAKRKSELKGMAKEIKKLKPIFKDSQRNVSRTLDTFNVEQSTRTKDMKYNPSVLSMVRSFWRDALGVMWEHQYRLWSLQVEYRRKHIIYCLYNGTPIEKIEPNHDEKSYYWGLIKNSIEYRSVNTAQRNWESEQILKYDIEYKKGLFFEHDAV